MEDYPLLRFGPGGEYLEDYDLRVPSSGELIGLWGIVFMAIGVFVGWFTQQ